MSSADKARRWRQILTDLRPDLRGEWTLRGAGLDTVLAREPLGWALAWIGWSGSPTRPVGWVAAGVQPLVAPFTGWVMTYGLRMDEVRSGPPTVDLSAGDALDQARRFVLDAGLEKIDSWPAERLADVAERDYAQDPRRRRTHWHQLPGWRVVNGTASPVEPATALAELSRDRAAEASGTGARQLGEQAAFYEGLVRAWHDGERDTALRFLTEQRDRALAARKLDRTVTP
ncbi:hypothetical protein GCE86_14220 [Micromonospora terminaliae]|uniref:Uncharacterized protein n=1 Tax=Micromonospora terminaliae TaxID=1914461 RepID=A0AAJ2ZD39_9ACTN|nr:hypothetical protein [Micromonospora terminaliae]NES27159.1 hypothetical protein [Micromonospora terminaliae]QGL48078.1 hypothetical protein GCE86_14220 [Micromonospora terminaliae]